ncbi:MAG: hypothetical protein LBV17_07695 [Treponema sp.]|jgi:hypothetical protein|nr:hypothetical protein [Treponema sp.]
MAGILDEVMDGIAAKEKQGEQTNTSTTIQTQTTTQDTKQTNQTTGETKPMNTYSDDFKNKYGDKKSA